MDSTTQIEDLPLEMVCELFKYVQVKDLVACSMVNKRWNLIYSYCRVRRLATTDDLLDYFINWCNSNQSIGKEELCRPTIFSHLANKPLLSNLKHLVVCGKINGYDLNDLNRFEQLVHLDVYIDLGEEKVNLNLLKLKTLKIHQFNNLCPLSIDCPEISTLLYEGEYDEDSLLDIRHPETIKKLETFQMLGLKLTKFSGVEFLVTKNFQAISKATLLSLQKLKKLDYTANIGSLVGRDLVGDDPNDPGGRIKLALREFMDDLRALGRSANFKFRFSGFILTKASLDEFDFGELPTRIWADPTPFEFFCMRNYQFIDLDGTLDFIYHLDYALLMSNSVEAIPSCLYEKFTGVKSVVATGQIQNANHLLNFLSSLGLLKSLTLNRSLLNQEFYDQLPSPAHSLIELILISGCEPQLNFDFIAKFQTSLSKLSINQNLSFVSLISPVKHFGWLAEGFFYYRSNENKFLVGKAKGSRLCKVSDEHFYDLFETENPGEIVTFFKEL